MLDAFLEVIHGKTKQAQAQESLAALLEKLPRDVLEKVASGEISFEKKAYCGTPGAGTGASWLEQFRGTPLLDEAIAIEREELEVQMAEVRRREMEVETRQQLPSWDEQDLQHQQLSIRRKLLELDLAGGGEGAGGQEGEDMAPPDLEVMEASAAPPVPKALAVEDAGPPVVAEEDEEAEGNPFTAVKEEGPEVPKADAEEEPKKPKTEKTTTVTKEKPVDDKEKIDIKAAAARMKVAATRLPLGGEAEKSAGVVKATNPLMRGAQLLTGSRARALESQAANRGQSLARSAKASDRTMRAAVMGGDDVSEAVAQKTIRAGNRATMGAMAGQSRATRAAGKERAAVGAARKDALMAAGGLGLGGGAGAVALGQRKTAGAVDTLGATVAAGSQKIRQATQAVQKQVVKNNQPMLSKAQKLVGGGAVVGLAGGAAMGGHKKQAALSPEREEQIKEAFGAAVLQGLKGVKNFAQTAGKSIAGAAQAGGAGAAGQAALNAGRSGMMRAGNFIAQNPGAGAAMVAAPALAAGYAAGRQ